MQNWIPCSISLLALDQDSPPTIEMTAYRCRTSLEAASDSNKTDFGGYEADTDDTLRKKGKKEIVFKPSKFVPSWMSGEEGGPGGNPPLPPVWKPNSQTAI